MATRGGADVIALLYGGFSLAPYMASIPTYSGMAVIDDVTPFGVADQVQAYAGKRGITIQMKGFYDDAALASNAALVGQLSAAAPMCIGLAGNTVGAPMMGLTGVEKSYAREVAVGKITRVTADFVSTGEMDAGQIQQPLGAVVANGNSTAIDGTASSAFGLVAYLQVPALTLGTSTGLTVTMQDSADNAAWANISGGGFTVIASSITTTPVAQRLVIAGTIRRYTRAIWAWTGGAGGGSTATIFVGIYRGLTQAVSLLEPTRKNQRTVADTDASQIVGIEDDSESPVSDNEATAAAAGDATASPLPGRRRASPAATAVADTAAEDGDAATKE